MLQIRSNTQLETDERAAIMMEKQRARPVLAELADHVRHAFEAAEEHKREQGISDRILKSRRLKAGQYDSAKLQAIQQRGGTELFFNITETKCEALEAWLQDVFAPVDDRPWDIKPTPIPSLPVAASDRVVEVTMAEFGGRAVPAEEVQRFANDLYDEMLRQTFEDARKRAERMARKIEDQTAEGNFQDAMAKFISNLSTYPSAILKGPIFVSTQRLAWRDGKMAVEPDVIPTWYCVDPMDFFPGPNVRNVQEGYLCERTYYDRRQLAEMRGVDGWNVEAINSILSIPSDMAAIETSVEESERAALEDRDEHTNAGLAQGVLTGVEYWGAIRGEILRKWGMTTAQIPDPDMFYEVNCILIGHVIVRAVLNPDPLGRRPYYVTSFIVNSNSLWGTKSVPEKMEDCQEGVNGAQRNLLNNLAIASGPQVAVDMAAIPASLVPSIHKLWPWKVWPYDSAKAASRTPVTFFQPKSNSAELLEVSEYFERKSDDRTLIPRYVYGDEDMTGAGQTASGLSMLMNAASRGIKRVVKYIDRDVLRPAIQRIFTWNMMYLEDESLKGDAQVVARGALAMLTREQTQLRRQEFLNMTNNPTDLQIIGIEGRATLLREIAKGLDIPVEDIVPSKEDLQRRTEEQLRAQQAQLGEPDETSSSEP